MACRHWRSALRAVPFFRRVSRACNRGSRRRRRARLPVSPAKSYRRRLECSARRTRLSAPDRAGDTIATARRFADGATDLAVRSRLRPLLHLSRRRRPSLCHRDRRGTSRSGRCCIRHQSAFPNGFPSPIFRCARKKSASCRIPTGRW